MAEKTEKDEKAIYGKARRKALKTMVWAAPAVVATAAVRARASSNTCSPDTPIDPPTDPPLPNP